MHSLVVAAALVQSSSGSSWQTMMTPASAGSVSAGAPPLLAGDGENSYEMLAFQDKDGRIRDQSDREGRRDTCLEAAEQRPAQADRERPSQNDPPEGEPTPERTRFAQAASPKTDVPTVSPAPCTKPPGDRPACCEPKVRSVQPGQTHDDDFAEVNPPAPPPPAAPVAPAAPVVWSLADLSGQLWTHADRESLVQWVQNRNAQLAAQQQPQTTVVRRGFFRSQRVCTTGGCQ